jgi:hypothetical protein
MTAGSPTAALPETVVEAGVAWRIGRAWPAKDGSVSVEASADGEPHVRGGSWNAGVGVVLAPAASDRRLPDLAEVALAGTVLVHRPGRRAVVRSHDGTRYTKVVRAGRGAGVVAAAARGAEFERSFRAPAVLDARDSRVDFAALPGATLFDLARDPSCDDHAWRSIWRDWADAWVVAVGGSAPAVPGSSAHTSAHEAAVVADWAGHAAAVSHDAGDRRRTADAAIAVARLLAASPPDPQLLAHRDLHDKQVLWHRSAGLALLDLDTATRAEAALDLGNLAAHLQLRRRQGQLSPARERIALRQVHRAASELGVSRARFDAYRAASLLRIGCVYAYRPRWAALAAQLRAELAYDLRGDDESSLIPRRRGSHLQPAQWDQQQPHRGEDEPCRDDAPG